MVARRTLAVTAVAGFDWLCKSDLATATYCNPHTVNVGRRGSPKVTQNIGQTTLLVRRELLSAYSIQSLGGKLLRAGG
jgi:hypothetical protein